MLVILPFCARDKEQAIRLASWLHDMGINGRHDCLLCVHKDTDTSGVMEPLSKVFSRIAKFDVTDDVISQREMYVYAANIMWKRAANHVADMGEPMPWLWLEPDSVLLTPDALNVIEAEYKAAGKPFLHELVQTPTAQRNSGVGVYPAKVRDYTQNMWQLANEPWDVFLGPDFMPNTHHTKLIQDSFWMKRYPDVMPTFPDQASLGFIRPGVVLFHRCKTPDLIDRLREKLRGEVFKDNGTGPHEFLKAVETSVRQDVERVIAETHSVSMSEQVRFHVNEIAKLIDGKASRKQTFHTELRKVGLLGKAKVRA